MKKLTLLLLLISSFAQAQLVTTPTADSVRIGKADGTTGVALFGDIYFKNVTEGLTRINSSRKIVPYTLTESDIPSLTISKVTGLQDSLDNKAPSLLINAFRGSGNRGRNLFAGLNSGNLTGDHYAETGIGDSVLHSNITGYSNTAVGASSMRLNTTGFGNATLGTLALPANTTGHSNVSTGWHSMLGNTTGWGNTVVGTEGLRNNTTGIGNTVLGSNAGYNINRSYGIYIGNEAGYNATKDSTLYIDVSATSDPLIYGDFSLRTVKFNNSGGFISIGNITAPVFIGALTGNASGSSTSLATSRTIFGQSFNGTANVSGDISDILKITGRSGAINGGYIFGGNVNSTGITDATRKYMTLATPHYTNAQAPISSIIVDGDLGTNIVKIGGGQATLNAATSVEIYAAATNTTAGGTKIVDITTAGMTTITQSAGDNSTKVATTAYVDAAVSGTGTPTISVNSNAGTGASASIVGNNKDGVVTINFTGVSASNGVMATITMGGGFSYSTKCTPVLTLESSSTGVAAGTGNLITTDGTTTTWSISISPSNLSTSGVFKFNYHNGGY